MASEIIVDGENPTHMLNSQGHAVPVANISQADRLMTETVNTIFQHADELFAKIGRFKAHVFDDVYTTRDLMAEQYGLKRGGAKGNITLTRFDGLARVSIKIADRLAFGPQLQIAKQLVDDYIEAFRDDIPDEIMPLLTHAFQMEKPGIVNRHAIYGLQRLKIDHPIWKQAMQAITDSRMVLGSKSYICMERRADYGAPWQAVTIDLAKA
jgi:hypothetical protein